MASRINEALFSIITIGEKIIEINLAVKGLINVFTNYDKLIENTQCHGLNTVGCEKFGQSLLVLTITLANTL